MKRIAFIAASTAVLVQSTKTDMKILQNMGVEIHLLCPTHHRNISEEAISQFNEIYPKCIWHDVPFVNSISAFQKNKSATQTLKKKLSEIQPDVIHCFGTVANYYTKKALAALQVSASCKTFYYTPCDFPLYQGASLPRKLFYRHIEKKDTTIPSTVLPVCEMDADYLHDKLHQDTPQTSYHRLAYEYYATPVRTGVDIRKAWNIPEDATLLLSIGELRPNKRFRIVLQAMARLREKYDLHYILCGTGSDLDFLQKLTRRLHLQDRVHFVGYRTDIPDFLGAADIFCYPAKQGNDCITVQEAAAAGLPIISARCPGMKWYAERELFEPISLKGDMVDTCAAAITKLIEDKLLQKQMGAANRAQAKKFDRDDNKQEESYEILRRNHYFPTVEHIKAK